MLFLQMLTVSTLVVVGVPSCYLRAVCHQAGYLISQLLGKAEMIIIHPTSWSCRSIKWDNKCKVLTCNQSSINISQQFYWGHKGKPRPPQHQHLSDIWNTRPSPLQLTIFHISPQNELKSVSHFKILHYDFDIPLCLFLWPSPLQLLPPLYSEQWLLIVSFQNKRDSFSCSFIASNMLEVYIFFPRPFRNSPLQPCPVYSYISRCNYNIACFS